MYDAWANARGTAVWGQANQQAIMNFNHLPGGSNVLYLNGHVEFLKHNSKFPLIVPDLNNGTYGGSPQWGLPVPRYVHLTSEAGGFG